MDMKAPIVGFLVIAILVVTVVAFIPIIVNTNVNTAIDFLEDRGYFVYAQESVSLPRGCTTHEIARRNLAGTGWECSGAPSPGYNYGEYQWGFVTDLGSGAGGSNQSADGRLMRVLTSGGVPNASSTRRTNDEVFFSVATSPSAIIWSEIRKWEFPFMLNQAHVGGISRATWGKDEGEGPGSLNKAGIGVEIRNVSLFALCHDGTVYDEIDLNYEMDGLDTRILTVDLDGVGNGSFYIDGVLLGTADNCPVIASDSATAAALMSIEAVNAPAPGGQDQQSIFVGPFYFEIDTLGD